MKDKFDGCDPRALYAAAQLKRYEKHDLDASLDDYERLLAAHPDSVEAGHAAQQIGNIYEHVVPESVRVMIALSAARGYLAREGRTQSDRAAAARSDASVADGDVPQDRSASLGHRQGRDEAVSRYRSEIRGFSTPLGGLPAPLMPVSILWMCSQLADGTLEHDSLKFQRWLGFVQCAMIANRALSTESAKVLASEESQVDRHSARDLANHHDPRSSFRLELGGEG